MQYTTENTEGYSSEDLETLNRIYEHRIALLDEDGRENRDLLQHLSEEVLADYDLARDLVPDALLAGEGEVVPISRIVDLEIRGSGDERAAVALVDLDGCEGVLAVIYPGGFYLGTGRAPRGRFRRTSRRFAGRMRPRTRARSLSAGTGSRGPSRVSGERVAGSGGATRPARGS